MTTKQSFRMLTEIRIERALKAGGMIVERDGLAMLHARRDARAHIIGGVPPHVLARLKAGLNLQAYDDPGRFVWKHDSVAAPAYPPQSSAFDPERLDVRYARAADRFRADYSIAGGIGRRLPFKWARAGTHERGARDRLLALEAKLGLPRQRLIERWLIARASLARLVLESRDEERQIVEDLILAFEQLAEFYGIASTRTPAPIPRQRSTSHQLRFMPQTRDHGGKPVRPLLRESTGDANLVQEALGIEGRDGRRWRAIEQPYEERDEPGDDHRIGFGAHMQMVAMRLGDEPDLRCTAAHARLFGTLVRSEGWIGFAEIDEMLVARFPIIEPGEVFAKGVGAGVDQTHRCEMAFAAPKSKSPAPERGRRRGLKRRPKKWTPVFR